MTFFFHVKKLKYTNFCLFVCFVLFFEIHKFKAEVTKLNIVALDYKVCFSLKALCTLIFYQHIEFFAGWILQNWWPLAMFYYIFLLSNHLPILFSHPCIFLLIYLQNSAISFYSVSFYTAEIKSTLNNTYKFISCTKWLRAYEEFKY